MTQNIEQEEPTGAGNADGELGTGVSTRWKRGRIPGVAMAALFWVVAIVFWGQHFIEEPEQPAPEHLRYGDVSTQLQLLMQGKIILGQGMAFPQGGTSASTQISLEAIAKEIEKLDGAAARALAALHLYLKPDDADGALAQLEAAEELELGEMEIQAMVRQEIVSPGTLTQEQLDEVQFQMHWFAHPLLLAREESGHPDREKLLFHALALIIFAGSVALFLTLGFFLGVVLLVVAAVQHFNGKSPLRFDASQGGSRGQIWGFVAYLGVMGAPIILFLLGKDMPIVRGAAFGVSILVGVGVAIAFSRGSFGERTRALGMHTGRGIFREIGSGIVGYCCVLPIALVGAMISLLLWWVTSLFPASEATETVTGHPIGEMFFDAPAIARFGLLLLAAVGAPLLEETMFRGVLHRGLRRSFSLPVAGFIGAICFAAVHPQDIVALPVLAALAFGFTLIREWRDSLIASMVAHGLHNGTLMAGLWIATM